MAVPTPTKASGQAIGVAGVAAVGAVASPICPDDDQADRRGYSEGRGSEGEQLAPRSHIPPFDMVGDSRSPNDIVGVDPFDG
jgi:hypothetical protein